jgi:Tfp pilus assembly pilus retraction ATPase PilT
VDISDLDRLLIMLGDLDGSDLHIKAGAPPRMRLAGALRTMEEEEPFTS